MATDSKTSIQNTLKALKANATKAGAGDDKLRGDLANLRKDFESRTGRRQELETQFSSSNYGKDGKFDPSLKNELFDLRKSLPGMQSQINTAQEKLDSSSTGKMERDAYKGAEFGAAVLDGGLGKLGEDADVMAALARRKQMSETGLSSDESVAQREKALSGIDQATQTGLRGLQARLSASGVKGATAGQQLIQRDLAGQQQKSQVERDLFLSGEEFKREAFDKYTSSLGNIKTFDLSQEAIEKDMLMSSSTTFMQMGSSERTAKMQAEMAAKAQEAAARAGRSKSSGITVICTELHRQNLIPTEIWKKNVSFGKNLDKLDTYTFKGYLLWGKPVANIMKKSKLATKILAPIMKLWVYNIGGKNNILNSLAFNMVFNFSKLCGAIINMSDNMCNKITLYKW